MKGNTLAPFSVRTRVLASFLAGVFVSLLVIYTANGQWAKLFGAKRKVEVVTMEERSQSLLEVATAIKQGGYILYFRHGNRDKWDSVVAFDIYEMMTDSDSPRSSFQKSVCLSAQGREEAKMIGKIFEVANVPVGTVATSPSCRAKQTAELAFGRTDIISAGLAHTPITNEANALAFKAELQRTLASIPVPPARNAVITAHGNTLENHPDLFVEGAEFLNAGLISETGFYVIQRGPKGALRVVQRFKDLGVFAANAIMLDPAIQEQKARPLRREQGNLE
jgi:phosphohistidine phosphatase SixA